MRVAPRSKRRGNFQTRGRMAGASARMWPSSNGTRLAQELRDEHQKQGGTGCGSEHAQQPSDATPAAPCRPMFRSGQVDGHGRVPREFLRSRHAFPCCHMPRWRRAMALVSLAGLVFQRACRVRDGTRSCKGRAGLLCSFTVPRRSRRQGLRVPGTLAAWRPSCRTCDGCAAPCRRRSRAIPPDHRSRPCRTISFPPCRRFNLALLPH
jgi:hypothetical protein